jgi:hypothetical protein
MTSRLKNELFAASLHTSARRGVKYLFGGMPIPIVAKLVRHTAVIKKLDASRELLLFFSQH